MQDRVNGGAKVVKPNSEQQLVVSLGRFGLRSSGGWGRIAIEIGMGTVTRIVASLNQFELPFEVPT